MLKLSSKTAQLLSSGQVITSACNVVKELVENSLDAAADIIDVKLEKGGLGKIEVRDNGFGIRASEISVAAQRHYTSKITSHSDLEALTSYGFRGEALSSICEVADVVITTRTKDEAYSFVYTLNAEGCIESKKPSHISQGTTVSVTNLFKNLPVRKQFFSSARKLKDQIKLIEDILMAFAISQPMIQFKLISDRCLIWQKPKSKDERNAFLHVLTLTNVNLLTLNTKCENTQIQMQIYFPELYMKRKSLDRFFLFINKRPIRNKKIEKVVRNYLLEMTGENNQPSGWPTVCLVIDIPPSLIDVNVNPNKTEVCLSCQETVLNLLEKMFESSSHKIINSDRIRNSDQEVSMVENTCQNTGQHEKIQATENEYQVPCLEDQVQTEKTLSCDIPAAKVVSDNTVESGTTSLKAATEIEALFDDDDDDTIIEQAVMTLDVCEKENNCVNQVNINADESRKSPSSDLPEDTLSKSTEIGTKSWSCGIAVADNDGQVIEPVKVIRPLSCSNRVALKRPSNSSLLKQSTLDHIASPSIPKRPRSIFEVSKDTTAKSWDDLNKNEQAKVVNIACEEYNAFSKQTTTKQQKKDRKSFVKLSRQNDNEEDDIKIPLTLDFEKLSQRIVGINHNHVAEESISVVGHLSKYKAVAIKCGSEFFLANLFRLQEYIILQKLLQTFKIPCSELETVIEISKDDIGAEAFDCLQNLPLSATDKSQPDAEVVDKRIICNGFKIKQFTSCSNSSHFGLYAMATSIPCYGLADLKELLLKVCFNKALNLRESRPTKCIYYLQGEASRLSRSSPALSSKAELLEALNAVKRNSETWAKTLSNSVCFHTKNIFFHLNSSKN